MINALSMQTPLRYNKHVKCSVELNVDVVNFPLVPLVAMITAMCVKINVVIHEVMLKFFSLQGADLNCIDCKGNSPLLLATSCGAWKTVALLLSKGDLPTVLYQQCS